MANASADRTPARTSGAQSAASPSGSQHLSAQTVSGDALTEAVAGDVIENNDLASTPQPEASRFEAIQLAAYLRAEQRGFEPGYELEDWLAAERDLAEREGAGTVG